MLDAGWQLANELPARCIGRLRFATVDASWRNVLQNQRGPPPQDVFYYKGGCKSWKAESLTQTRCPENWPSGAQSGAQCQQHEDIIWKNLAGTTIVELWKALMTSKSTNKQPVLRLCVFRAMTFNIEARNHLKLIVSHLCILHRQCEIFLFVFFFLILDMDNVQLKKRPAIWGPNWFVWVTY